MSHPEVEQVSRLTLGAPNFGYCNSCGRAAIVAGVHIPGWNHAYNICSNCWHVLGHDFDRVIAEIVR